MFSLTLQLCSKHYGQAREIANISLKFIKTLYETYRATKYSNPFDFEETKDLEISYPIADLEVYNSEEVVKENELNAKCTTEELQKLEELLDRYRKVFSNDPFCTDLKEHDI